VIVVLAPVDQHLALALGPALTREDEVRVLGFESLRQLMGERLGVVVGDGRVQGDEELKPLGARGFREDLEPHAVEDRVDQQSHLGTLQQAGRGPRVEVEDQGGRAEEVSGPSERGVELQVRQVRGPDQAGLVVQKAVVHRLVVLLAHHRCGLHPSGPVLGALLLVEELALDAVGIPLQG
jgi:hypothetical protein